MRVLHLLAIVVTVASAHNFTAQQRAFQRKNTMQTIEELNSVLPLQGRIGLGLKAMAIMSSSPSKFVKISFNFGFQLLAHSQDH
jgi:hypothetical protein